MFHERRIFDILERILHKLEEIRLQLRPGLFSLDLTFYPGVSMSTASLPITTIQVGGTGQLVVQLLQTVNGVTAPYVAPAGAAPYTFAPAVTSNDADITIAPATTDVTGGTVPLAQQFSVADTAGDTVSTFTLTATATAPDGTALTDTITINLSSTPPTSAFSLSMAFYPAP